MGSTPLRLGPERRLRSRSLRKPLPLLNSVENQVWGARIQSPPFGVSTG